MCKIRLLISDFDGVLTNNKVLVFENGEEAVVCNKSDGLAVRELKKNNVEFLILSAEENGVVSMRARKLGVLCIQGCSDKEAVTKQLLEERGLKSSEAMFIGNDIDDLGAMKVIGWPVAPVDAHQDIKVIAKTVTRARGGQGVVREMADIILGKAKR